MGLGRQLLARRGKTDVVALGSPGRGGVTAPGPGRFPCPADRGHPPARRRARWCRTPVSYTHLRAHETVLDLVCRLLLEKKSTNATLNAPT